MSSHSIDAFFFDPLKLEEIADRYASGYGEAKPFPHVVIDDFLPASVLERILDEFPEPDDDNWTQRAGYGWTRETGDGDSDEYRSLGKLESTDPGRFNPHTRQLFAEFNSAVFLRFLEKLTGIEKLLPDPHLVGGGLHSLARGGKLRVHADFVWNGRIRLDRRLNLLLYLNKDWREEYGGQLELWSKDMTTVEQSILPVFNRCAIFTTSSTSWHGHPEPVKSPGGRRRKSLAMYYHTAGRPEGEVDADHKIKTLWKVPVGQPRPLSARLRSLLPPFAVDLARYLRWQMGLSKLLPPVLSRLLKRRG